MKVGFEISPSAMGVGGISGRNEMTLWVLYLGLWLIAQVGVALWLGPQLREARRAMPNVKEPGR